MGKHPDDRKGSRRAGGTGSRRRKATKATPPESGTPGRPEGVRFESVSLSDRGRRPTPRRQQQPPYREEPVRRSEEPKLPTAEPPQPKERKSADDPTDEELIILGGLLGYFELGDEG